MRPSGTLTPQRLPPTQYWERLFENIIPNSGNSFIDLLALFPMHSENYFIDVALIQSASHAGAPRPASDQKRLSQKRTRLPGRL